MQGRHRVPRRARRHAVRGRPREVAGHISVAFRRAVVAGVV